MYDASIHLPDVATDHERRIASVSFWTAPLDVAIINLTNEKNPAKCRPEILPWLAYEASADFWDPSWTIEKQRYAISVQWDIHRYKGTPFAVKRALSILELAVTLEEWWQVDPPRAPGTFKVKAFVIEGRTDGTGDFFPRLKKQTIEAINRSKPLSRHFDLELGVQTSTNQYVGVISSTGGLYVGMLPVEDPEPIPSEQFVAVASAFGGIFTGSLEV